LSSHSVRGAGRGQLTNVINSSERPAEVADRAVPGHWEGDLVVGSGNTAVATLVERTSRYVMLVALPDGRTSDKVVAALGRRILELPEQVRHSITWDNGKEMALHTEFTTRPACRSTSATRRAPGSAARTEHQRAPAPIPPEAHQLRPPHPSRSRRHRRAAQQQAPPDPRLHDTIEGARQRDALTP
jgi:hypothetical protein